MRHRHLEYPADTPAEKLPTAAIVDILDRGDLDDWAPLARAVAADPHGIVAQRVRTAVDEFPMYGTSAMWRDWIERCRIRRAPERRLSLAGLRRASGLTQAQVAFDLGISQSDVSKLERRRDVRLSTMRDYTAALGARLRLVADTRDGPVDLEQPGEPPR